MPQESEKLTPVRKLRDWIDANGVVIHGATPAMLLSAAGLLELETENAEYEQLSEKMATILLNTAAVLKGEPEPLTLHSWHDLAEVATKLLARAEAAEAKVAAVRELHTKSKHGVHQVCDECLQDDGTGSWDYVNYPCPTIRALDGAE